MNRYNKPPLGVMPKCIWDDKRFNMIALAIKRYLKSNCKIPIEWVEEYNSLIKVGDK